MNARPHRRLRIDAPLGLRHDACLPLNFRYAACTACRDACPTGALRLTVDAIVLHHACAGCGRCAAACPTGALRLEGSDLPEVLPHAAGVVRIECRKVPERDAAPQGIRVPCLGALAVSQWLALVAQAEGRVIEVMDRGWCEDCEAGGRGIKLPALDHALALMAEVRVPAAQRPAPRAAPLPLRRMADTISRGPPAPPVSRRGFFGQVARGATAAAATASDALPEPTPPARIRPGALAAPERRRRLELVAFLARRTGAPLPASLYPTLRVSAECRGDQVCGAVCPTQALHTYDDGAVAGVAFDAGDCLACGACVSACPSHAIALGTPAAPFLDGAVRLTRRGAHECPDCGARSRAAGERCDRCRNASALAGDAFAAIFHSAACSDACAGEPAPTPHHGPMHTRGGGL